jgi:hypothetical protein
MKNTGNTIVASDGTTAVLSESSGTVTFDADVSTIGSATISGGSITETEIDLKSSGTTIFASDGTTAVLSESGGVVTLTADAAVIEGSSSGDLVRITQTGTGNALVVEDSANPDGTPFVVTANGNVGIGEVSTDSKLQVGTAQFDPSLARTTAAIIVRSDTGSTTGDGEYSGAITFGKIDSSRPFGSIAGVQIGSDIDGGGLAFFTKNGTSTNDIVSERMRIDSSGNVGIGTSSPNQLLNVAGIIELGAGNGSVDARMLFNGDSTEGVGWIGIPSWDTDSLYVYGPNSSGGNDQIMKYDGNTKDFSFHTNGNVKINNLGSGDVYATSGTLYISSDIRLKNDLGVIDESGIEIIKQLTPRYYSWKDDENSRQQLGFFAQEVFPILPEAVPRDLKYEQNGVDENGEPILEQVLDDNGEPDYQWGFATQPIVAMCVKAIQEQQTIIESQQSQIDALTARIEALETT